MKLTLDLTLCSMHMITCLLVSGCPRFRGTRFGQLGHYLIYGVVTRGGKSRENLYSSSTTVMLEFYATSKNVDVTICDKKNCKEFVLKIT